MANSYSLLHEGELQKGETRVKYSVLFSPHGVYIHSTTIIFFIYWPSVIFFVNGYGPYYSSLARSRSLHSMHTLSDPKEDCLCVTCDHAHDKCCPSCNQLKAIMSWETKTAMTWCTHFNKLISQLNQGKAHLLRSIQQDEARTSLLETCNRLQFSSHRTGPWSSSHKSTGERKLIGLPKEGSLSTLVLLPVRLLTSCSTKCLFT